jgi:acyl-CoA thioesterase FadM
VSADVLTAWGVVLEVDASDAVELAEPGAPFARGRDAYFERCPTLGAFLLAEVAELEIIAEWVEPVGEASAAAGVRIGVSAVEVRPSSFDMAVRIRPAGEHAGQPANGRCTVVIKRLANGEPIPIPRAVHDELVGIQLNARELC